MPGSVASAGRCLDLRTCSRFERRGGEEPGTPATCPTEGYRDGSGCGDRMRRLRTVDAARNTVPGSISRCGRPLLAGVAPRRSKNLSLARSLGQATPSVDRGTETREKGRRRRGHPPSRVRRREGDSASEPRYSTSAITRRGPDPMRGNGLPSLARARSRSPNRSRTPERSEGWRRSRHKTAQRGTSGAPHPA